MHSQYREPETNDSDINGNGTNGTTSPVVPFDGGMSLVLLVSGIGYGAKRGIRKIKPTKS